MSILRNGGQGRFESIRFTSGFKSPDVAVAEFDGGRRADIVVIQGATETDSIHLQRKGFQFGPPAIASTDLSVAWSTPTSTTTMISIW